MLSSMQRLVATLLAGIWVFASALATARTVCNPSSVETMLKTCAPELTLFVPTSGSPFVPSVVMTLAKSALFDPTAGPLIGIVDSRNTSVRGMYGFSKTALTGGVAKRLLVVSSVPPAGPQAVSLLLARKPDGIAEAYMPVVGPVSNGQNFCKLLGMSAGFPVVECAMRKYQKADMALANFNADEFFRLESYATQKPSTLTSTPLGILGFGMIVNQRFYEALQSSGIKNGSLPSACSPGTVNFECQPSLRRADVASLYAKLGSIKSAAGLIPGDSTLLVLFRGPEVSGGITAVDMYFNGNRCRKPPAKPMQYVDEVAMVDQSDTNVAFFVIDERFGGPFNEGYGLAVTSLNINPDLFAQWGWHWVKLEGVSPNYNADGSPAYMSRSAFARGGYGFAFTTFAITQASTAVGTTDKSRLLEALTETLMDSRATDLGGFAYLDGLPDADPAKPKQSLYRRAGISNCSPYIRK